MAPHAFLILFWIFSPELIFEQTENSKQTICSQIFKLFSNFSTFFTFSFVLMLKYILRFITSKVEKIFIYNLHLLTRYFFPDGFWKLSYNNYSNKTINERIKFLNFLNKPLCKLIVTSLQRNNKITLLLHPFKNFQHFRMEHHQAHSFFSTSRS